VPDASGTDHATGALADAGAEALIHASAPDPPLVAGSLPIVFQCFHTEEYGHTFGLRP